MRYGDQLPVGLGVSTVLAEIDFETYSEAGMCWEGKWVGPPGAPKNSKGLPVVGVVNYTQHPSFEVLVLKYDLKDGQGPRTWRPGEPPPQPLFDHIAAGRLVEAHNVGFERRVWAACQRLYGWPGVPWPAWRCSAAKSRAWGRPGGLDAAAAVAGTARKDPAGDQLIRQLTMPRKPTKADPSFRLTRQSAPEKFAALDAYCEQDIRAEAELSAATPDLSPQELEYWQIDQAINERGVAVDVPLVDAGIRIVNAGLELYGSQVKQLTGGIAASEVAQLSLWCAETGYVMAAMDEEAISEALDDPTCPPLVRQVLALRARIASASVKKLFALRNAVTQAGRVHDLFIFHGARTGRPTGDGPQPTNFPKAGPHVWRCQCGRHYGESRPGCPWCGAGPEGRIDHKGQPLEPGAKPNEWSPEAMADAIEVVRLGDLATLEMFFGDAFLTLAGCLRGTFIAAPGHDLVSSDWTAIEAVVLACLAGEQWRIDLFRQGGKIYEASGAKVGRLEYEEVLEYKKRTGQHHPIRQVGKTCLTADTQVLTDSGVKALTDVNGLDRVWDGTGWVKHGGVVYQGRKDVIRLAGVRVTHDHKVYTGSGWIPAGDLTPRGIRQAVGYAEKALPEGGPVRSSPRQTGPLESVQVFDIVNAGPLRRFTILTDAGPLIVSNCELALGYQGWVGAWRAFDPKGTQSDNELRDIILAWREASPAIVEFWGGQSRRTQGGWKEEFFGVEGAFIQAILNPGREFDCRGLKFQMAGDCLYLTLLSGRRIAYHTPRLHPSDKLGCRYSISYWGWNTNPKNGPRGWIQIYTWGGRIVENIVQATSNDILRFTSVNLERAGYPIVLHVYDEIVCEVPRGVGSVEELEAWMRYLPPWARCPDGQRWPVGAAGGWRAERYRKG